MGQCAQVRNSDLVWNRACSRPESASLPGDRALADVLLAHGYAMNGGLLHAVEDLKPTELVAAMAGYRFFGLTGAVGLIEEATRRLGEGLDDDALDALEAELDQRYAEVGDDQVLTEAFERRLAESPNDFAPLTEEDKKVPQWVERVQQDMRSRGGPRPSG